MALPPLRVAGAALLLALGIALPAQAATMSVSRRVDPSLDRYLFTAAAETPLSAMTDDQKWIASHARPLVVHDSDPRVSLNVTGWAKAPRTAAYFNGTGVNAARSVQLEQAGQWLVSKGTTPVYVDGGWRMLDLRKSAARRWWLYGSDGKATCNPDRDQRAALDLYACGYKSLWIDNALTTPTQGFTPTPNISRKSWARGVLTTLKTLKARKPKGTTFTINMHWTDTSYGYASRPRLRKSDPAIRAARYADQVVIEGGAIDAGLHYALTAKSQWSYRRLLNFARDMHKVKTKLQWEMTSSADLTRSRTPITGAPQLGAIPSCIDTDVASGPWSLGDPVWQAHVRAAAFNFATAVLSYKKGDSVGDMCQYPDRGWAGYTANLGKPKGKYSDRNGVLKRKLQRGIVIVNPSDTAKRVRLPKAGVNLASTAWPASSAKVRVVRLAPRSAAVVKY